MVKASYLAVSACTSQHLDIDSFPVFACPFSLLVSLFHASYIEYVWPIILLKLHFDICRKDNTNMLL